MPVINISRQGVGTGVTNSDFATARSNAASAVTDGITGEADVQYFSSGRTKRFKRVFLYFDTSGITGTLSSATVEVDGGSVSDADPNDTILIKSSAFGGDGGTALATSDHFSSLDYTTAYSAELTVWNTSTNKYVLTAAALADIKNNDHFTLAIIDNDNDYANSDTTATADITIDFDVTITLNYVLAGYGNTVMTVASANINKVKGVATANIETVIGVD